MGRIPSAPVSIRYSQRAKAMPLGLLVLVFVMLPLASCGKKNAGVAEQSTGPRIKWQYKSTAMAISHPAISPDGTIYVGTHSNLVALSPEGKLVWQAGVGEAGTPVVSEDGTIYLDTWHGFVFGVGKEGQVAWRPGYGLIGFNAPPALGTTRRSIT